MRQLTLVKLGGSLITDKRRPETPRPGRIARLAREIAAARDAGCGPLVLGHGSGSFGHVAAKAAGLEHGLGADGDTMGAARTHDAAARLDRLLLTALLDAGVPALSLPPSSWLVLDDGEVATVTLEPLLHVLDAGLLPVVYGDVVADRQHGLAIASTETVLSALVEHLPDVERSVDRLLWAGETAGIIDPEGRTLAEVSAASIGRARTVIGAPVGTDVTGGMLLRLETSYRLARHGVPSLIFDGRADGALERALLDVEVPGTRVVAGITPVH